MDKHLEMAPGGQHGGHDDAGTAGADSAIDPVCGMTVDIVGATVRGLSAEHGGMTYYFCGKGCMLEFGDDPGRFLDPSYTPSM